MKKYNVRVYFSTFVDVEVEAENAEEAQELGESIELDVNGDDLMENLTKMDGETEIEEL